MRRPLAAAALLFVAAVRLTTLAFRLPVPVPEYEDGQAAVYTGKVMDIADVPDSWSKETAHIIYLKDAISESPLLQPGESQNKDLSEIHPSSGNDESEDLISTELREAPGGKRPGGGYAILCRPQNGEALPEIGSYVRYEGKVRHFRQAGNPGEFDAKTYYNRQGYAFELTQAVLVGKSAGYSRFGQSLYRLKKHLGAALEALLPVREASVAKAMLLGEKKGMDAELKNMYQQAGISHILAISGLHISLLGTGVYQVLSRCFGKRAGCVGACILLASYLCMTGFSSSSLRAGIMFALAMAAQLAGRTYDPATALAVAAALLAAGNPARLEDAGFGLSFSAALGAVAVVPAFGRMKQCGRKKQSGRYAGEGGWKGRFRVLGEGMRTGFRASFCISLTTLPVLLGAYYEWNLLSVLLNMAVVPLMGVLLGGCILLAAAGGILLAVCPALLWCVKPAALLVRGILGLYEWLCRLGNGAGLGLLRTGKPQTWQTAVFCAGLFLLVLCAENIPRAGGYGAALILCLVFLINPFAGGQLTMLDVGQGDCIYIRTEEGKHYLYDGGSSSERDVGTWRVIPFLKYQGVGRLEMIFVSHWDADHISAVLQILEWAGEGGVELGGLTLPAGGPEDEAFCGLLEAAFANGVPVYRMRAGEEVRDAGSRFLALHPAEGETITDRNACSLVLRYSSGEAGFFALLMGDIGSGGEEQILREYGAGPGTCSVLKTAHHGSDTSSSEAFLDWACPRVALISCGRDNSYGHPHETVLARFAERRIPVFVTARSGAVTVRFRKGRTWAETFLDID